MKVSAASVVEGQLPAWALAAFALFVSSVLAMPLLQDGYDPIEQTISEGVLGRYGFVQVVGLLALAAGSLALAAALVQTSRDRRTVGTAALLTCSSFFVIILALVPADPGDEARTTAGRIHNGAAAIAFIAVWAAMWWSALASPEGSCAHLPRWVSIAFASAMTAFLVALSAGVEPRGIVQRLSVACELAWLAALAVRLRVEAAGLSAPRSG